MDLFIVSILTCWTFIPAFIALVHTVMLLSMSDKEFENKYMKKKMPPGTYTGTVSMSGGEKKKLTKDELVYLMDTLAESQITKEDDKKWVVSFKELPEDIEFSVK